MPRDNWTHDELVIAFNLYCKIPFGKIHNRNPEIIALANSLGRSPSALSWKLANFARLDPALKKRDIAGAAHGSQREIAVWAEFNADWDKLAFESERLIAKITKRPLVERADIDPIEPIGAGRERDALVRVRVNQGFFRAAVLAAYSNKCCVTGLEVTALLNASHIVPWSVDTANRVNPRNGLCLNAVHDRAFDRGLLTILPNFTIRVSPMLKKTAKSKAAADWLLHFDGSQINLPKRFLPEITFLKYHNDSVFKG
jgi:putative restriction endonuclease